VAVFVFARPALLQRSHSDMDRAEIARRAAPKISPRRSSERGRARKLVVALQQWWVVWLGRKPRGLLKLCMDYAYMMV